MFPPAVSYQMPMLFTVPSSDAASGLRNPRKPPASVTCPPTPVPTPPQLTFIRRTSPSISAFPLAQGDRGAARGECYPEPLLQTGKRYPWFPLSRRPPAGHPKNLSPPVHSIYLIGITMRRM